MKRVASVLVAVALVAPWSVHGSVITAAAKKSKVDVVESSTASSRKIKVSPSRSRAYARELVSKTEFACLDKIWTRESHWNHKADNPTSTAYGIPQMLKMKEKNPYKQIHIGLKYIRHRYGTACKAWSFWKKHHWY